MQYQHFTSTDFALDEYFQRWVISPDEETDSFWDTWLLQYPEKKVDVENARQMIDAFKFKTESLPNDRHQRLYDNILNVIQNDTATRPLVETVQTTPVWTHWMRVAAVLLVGVLTASGILFWYTNRPVTYQTKYGEKQVITLPDQSKVTLNAHSTLEYRPDWSDDKTREVWLQGEAFFEVSKRNTVQGPAKFQVHTDDLTVEVLGTKFNVSKRDKLTAVTLDEGKVKLELNTRQPSQNIFMTPGEMVKFSEENQKIERSTVKAETQSSWIKNYWVLDHTTLAEIIQRIESTYGYTVTVANTALLTESISGVLPTHNFQDLLEVIAVTYNVKIEQRENQLFIKK